MASLLCCRWLQLLQAFNLPTMGLAFVQEAPFFRSWGGSWDTDYGRFFLGWYSGELLAHGERLMTAAASIFKRQWPVRPLVGAAASA